MDTTGQPDVPAYSCDQTTGRCFSGVCGCKSHRCNSQFQSPRICPLLRATFWRISACAVPTRRHTKIFTKPDITGPGVLIYAAFPLDLGAYGTISGTSMSSPHTAGSAALVRAVHGDWTVSEDEIGPDDDLVQWRHQGRWNNSMGRG